MITQPLQRSDIESLARATLANGFIQLAMHFPHERKQASLTVEQALEQAVRLAEEAITLAPRLPDGHVVLGRIILCTDAPQALNDAIEILQHALSLDAEHDPARIALATAYLSLGKYELASQEVVCLIQNGNALPQPFLLRALIAHAQGDTKAAKRDMERVLALAPKSGVFHLDAAMIALAAEAPDLAQEYQRRAAELLGDAVGDFQKALKI